MSDIRGKRKLPPIFDISGKKGYDYINGIAGEIADALIQIAEEVSEIRKKMDRTLELFEKEMKKTKIEE